MKLLVTDGAGFIGSAFVRLLLGSASSLRVINLDKLTYAGNLENLEAVAGACKPLLRAPRHLRRHWWTRS